MSVDTRSWDPTFSFAAELLTGTGSAFSTFGQQYSGMSAPSGSSYGGGIDPVIPPPITTLADRDTVESVPDSESDNDFETESEPEPEPETHGRGKTVMEKTPRPQREKKKGEKTTHPWTAGKGLSGKGVSGWVRGMVKGKGKK